MNNNPEIVHAGNFVTDESYARWLQSLKDAYRSRQAKAAVHVNSELLRFYWSLGKDIVSMQADSRWGNGFFNQLSLDLCDAFPGNKGFSVSNLKYIKRWYFFYNQSDIIRQQPADELQLPEDFFNIPWFHHVEIFTKCQSVTEAFFYLHQTLSNGWSRRILQDNLRSQLYQRQGKAVTNFDHIIPTDQIPLMQEVLKDPYCFDFLSLQQGYDELQLEEALTHNITRFLLELGKGFSFVGRQVELMMPSGKNFRIDMLFYHIQLKCYVVVELKVVDFEPEFVGKMNLYVTAVDKLLKRDDDNPTIGLLICRGKDDMLVEWSFQDVSKPIGVASYENEQILKALPSREELQAKVKETLSTTHSNKPLQ